MEYINDKLNIRISHGCLLPKLLWIKNNESEYYKKIYKILVPHGYIAYKLIGKTSIDYDTSTIIGGGANSLELCQIISDVLGRELHLSNKKSTALGIAFLAGYGSGEIKDFSELKNNWYKDDIIIKPKEENVNVYNNLFPKYEKIKKNIYELDSLMD